MTFKKNISNTRERATNAPLPTRSTILLLTGLLLAAAALAIYSLTAQVQAGVTSPDVSPLYAPTDMVVVPSGEFVMGNKGAYADETPLHAVKLESFYLDEHEVTNSQFLAFVKATGYVTKAERDGHCWAYFDGEKDWQYAAGTDWRHPYGPNSTIEDKMNHPVVCVSWNDADTYARWAGKRLPTEAEWEYAARAGSSGHFMAITESATEGHGHNTGVAHTLAVIDRSPSGKSHGSGAHHVTATSSVSEVKIEANVWQGHWPEHNKLDDGFYYTAPAESFDANSMGVYDMLGNAWEWTVDWYDSSYYAASPISNPQGPQTGKNRVARGGSWFCSPNYCGAYSTPYRGASPPDHAFNNVGFRCAMDVPTGKK